jgi:hypothetical protein
MKWKEIFTTEELKTAQMKYRRQAGTCAPRAIGKTYLRLDANGDPIWMKLSFEEWMDIWWNSGHWNERSHAGYQMCRTNDIGHYELGNVRIDTRNSNVTDFAPRLQELYARTDAWEYQVTKQGRPCTIDDGKTVFASQHQLRKVLGCGKSGRNHPDFRYLSKDEIENRCTMHVRNHATVEKRTAYENGWRPSKTFVFSKSKPCTIDGVHIYPSLAALARDLGHGSRGRCHPNFRYLSEEELKLYPPATPTP